MSLSLGFYGLQSKLGLKGCVSYRMHTDMVHDKYLLHIKGFWWRNTGTSSHIRVFRLSILTLGTYIEERGRGRERSKK